MREFIREYKNPNTLPLNYALINHYFDNDVVPYIIDSFKSLEVLPNIKILGYTYEDDERNIDSNDFIRTRGRDKKNKNVKYMPMAPSRYHQITIKIQITHTDKNGVTEQKIIDKKIIIPYIDKDGYMTIKGKRYVMMYQLVDASTYTSRNNLVYKSLTGVAITRTSRIIKTVNTEGETKHYQAPLYTIKMFGKPVEILLMYFATMGVYNTLRYFSVYEIIDFVSSEEVNDDSEYVYVPISKKLYIRIVKKFFEESQYVQSIVAMIDSVVTNRFTLEDLDSKDFWIEKIGSRSITNPYNYHEKGMNSLLHFSRLLDETSKKILKVRHTNKANIYAIVRWMVQNYGELRKKDNMSLMNKRLRGMECMSTLLNAALTERVSRCIRMGKKAEMDDFLNIFKFPGDIIITELHKSGLMRFDDRVNDQDLWSKLRYTTKGPNSLGGKNDKNISIKFRGIDPSYIGRIDLNVCGNSDPGTRGILTPMCKTHGLYFHDIEEPEEFMYTFNKDVQEYTKHRDDVYVDVSSLTIDEYYDALDFMQEIKEKVLIERRKY